MSPLQQPTWSQSPLPACSIVALKGDGSLVGWGQSAALPLTCNAVGVAAASTLPWVCFPDWIGSVVLQSDGTVTFAPPNIGSRSLPMPVGLSNVIQIAAGPDQYLALKDDGTIARGTDRREQFNRVSGGADERHRYCLRRLPWLGRAGRWLRSHQGASTEPNRLFGRSDSFDGDGGRHPACQFPMAVPTEPTCREAQAPGSGSQTCSPRTPAATV